MERKLNRKDYRKMIYGIGVRKLKMMNDLNTAFVTPGAFGYGFKFRHEPRKIENKTVSKRVLRKIMLDKFMEV